MKHNMINYNPILEKKIQLHYIDTDSCVISTNAKEIIKDLKNLEDLFDFSNLNENHQLFINKNKKVIGKIKIETLKYIWIDEFVCLRSKLYSFKCGDSRNKIKDISKSYSKINIYLMNVKRV